MSRKEYTQVQVLLPEIQKMLEEGKTQREVAEHLGLRDKYVVKQLLNRERRRAAKKTAGITLRPKGRPRKDAAARDVIAEQQYEINQLKMENKLLRDFLQLTGRK
ncbi:MAG: imidazolonepropionase [Clostridia bacterium]|nr:imidazolonepropionase [Clostridia bacterium]